MAKYEETVASQDTPLGYQQITNLASATALTIPVGAKRALIQAEVQAVRWRDDGTDPTASVGVSLNAGDILPYTGNLQAFRAIQIGSGAILNMSYYG